MPSAAAYDHLDGAQNGWASGARALLVAFDIKRCEVEQDGWCAAGGDPVAFEIVRVAGAAHRRDGDHVLRAIAGIRSAGAQ